MIEFTMNSDIKTIALLSLFSMFIIIFFILFVIQIRIGITSRTIFKEFKVGSENELFTDALLNNKLTELKQRYVEPQPSDSSDTIFLKKKLQKLLRIRFAFFSIEVALMFLIFFSVSNF